MDDRETSAERLLAARALAETLPGDGSRTRAVLVAGLGLGFTLSEVLSAPDVTSVTVVEIEEALVDWHRTGVVPRSELADPRVEVAVGDVRRVLPAHRAESFDALLIDVDNGPGFLVYEANADVYRPAFLRACRRVTRRGGVTAVWSADESPSLFAALDGVFDRCQVVTVPVRLGRRDTTYWLYVAHRAATAGDSVADEDAPEPAEQSRP